MARHHQAVLPQSLQALPLKLLALATEPLPSSINVTLMSGFPSQEVPLQIALHARPPHVLSEQRAIQLLNFVILIIMAQPIIHFC